MPRRQAWWPNAQGEIGLSRPRRAGDENGLAVPDPLPGGEAEHEGSVQPVKSRVVCKSERKLLDVSVRLPWRSPWMVSR